MREDDTVYWVDEWASKQVGPGASSCIGVSLLKGNTLMKLDGITYMDTDTSQMDIEDMWDFNMRCLAEGEDAEHIQLIELSDEDAEEWCDNAYELYDEFADVAAKEEGDAAYVEDKLLEDNPYSEDEETELWEAWEAGWMAAFARDTGREYDEQDEEERLKKQEREDLRASQATVARWFHEEINANPSLTVEGSVL